MNRACHAHKRVAGPCSVCTYVDILKDGNAAAAKWRQVEGQQKRGSRANPKPLQGRLTQRRWSTQPSLSCSAEKQKQSVSAVPVSTNVSFASTLRPIKRSTTAAMRHGPGGSVGSRFAFVFARFRTGLPLAIVVSSRGWHTSHLSYSCAAFLLLAGADGILQR